MDVSADSFHFSYLLVTIHLYEPLLKLVIDLGIFVTHQKVIYMKWYHLL